MQPARPTSYGSGTDLFPGSVVTFTAKVAERRNAISIGFNSVTYSALWLNEPMVSSAIHGCREWNTL